MDEQKHLYGDHVHLIEDLMANTGLTRLSDASTEDAAVANIVKRLYKDALLRAVVNTLFPTIKHTTITPMAEYVGKRGVLESSIINPATKAAVCVLLRAGIDPAMACRSRLLGLLNNGNVSLHFAGASRKTDENHHVTGTAITYEKTGPLKGRILLIPDCIGATGSSVIKKLDDYGLEELGGTLAIATMHLIVAPEYIRAMTAKYPQVHIFALRLDRGMSSEEVQDSIPGTFPDREYGLTDTQYVAPGVGDMGWRLSGGIA